MIGSKIKQLLDKEGVSAEEFCAIVGISRGTAYTLFSKEHVDTKYLVQLSKHFDIPIGYFFEDLKDSQKSGVSVKGDRNTTISSGRDMSVQGEGFKGSANTYTHDMEIVEKLATCEKLLEAKDRLLEEKERTIKIYQQMIDMLTSGKGG